MPHLSRGSPTPAQKTPAMPRADAAVAPPPTIRGAVGIATYLRQAILDGVYLYGEKLPAERQFAAALKCSRTTVREALRILEQGNFISRRVGSGTFVTFLPDTLEDDVAEITNPVELIEVRLAVEPHMTRLATINATAKDIERLGEVLAKLEASGADASHFTNWDRQFHQLLADATHNPLMSAVYRHVNHVRGHAQWSAMKDKILSAERIAGYNRQHRDIYQAMCTRDADAAVRVIARHLRDARRDLLAT